MLVLSKLGGNIIIKVAIWVVGKLSFLRKGVKCLCQFHTEMNSFFVIEDKWKKNLIGDK